MGKFRIVRGDLGEGAVGNQILNVRGTAGPAARQFHRREDQVAALREDGGDTIQQAGRFLTVYAPDGGNWERINVSTSRPPRNLRGTRRLRAAQRFCAVG